MLPPSPAQQIARWMIGSVHLRVAVQAGACEQEFRTRIRGQSLRQRGQAAMAHGRVARLAQVRRPAHQQGRLVGPVRQMADAAILAGRRVLPQKGALFLGMTPKAGLVDQRFSRTSASPAPEPPCGSWQSRQATWCSRIGCDDSFSRSARTSR